jgi:hypothetical protein
MTQFFADVRAKNYKKLLEYLKIVQRIWCNVIKMYTRIWAAARFYRRTRMPQSIRGIVHLLV